MPSTVSCPNQSFIFKNLANLHIITKILVLSINSTYLEYLPEINEFPKYEVCIRDLNGLNAGAGVA